MNQLPTLTKIWTHTAASSLLAAALVVPAAAADQQVLLQAIQFPEDRRVDVELSAVHSVPGSLGAKVEYERGAAEVRLRAHEMVPAMALGGDVNSYIAWAVPRVGPAERLGELEIYDGDERTELSTDLKEFALLVTLEEHPKVIAPSGRIAFQNLAEVEKGATVAPFTFELASEMPEVGSRIERLASRERADVDVLQAQRQLALAERLHAVDYAPERVRDAGIALAQAQNFLDGGREKAAVDFAQRSVSASADALVTRDQEITRRDRVARQSAEQAEKERLAQRAESAERREEHLEGALQQSELTRGALEFEVAEKDRQLAMARSHAAALALEQQQAEEQLTAARTELQALNLASEDTRERADELLAQRAELSRRVGQLTVERERIEAERRELETQRSTLLDENQNLARLKSEAEAERERLAREKAAAVANLESTLSEIATTRRTARGLVMSLPDVLFDFDRATLRPEGTQTLAKLAGVALLVPELKFSVEGHTDSVGSDAYNEWLSEARAGSVADYLAQEGVAANRLHTEGYGERQPVVSNDTAAHRQMNRRVEIIVDAASLRPESASLR